MREFEDYSERHSEHLTMTRGDDGILEVHFHGEDDVAAVARDDVLQLEMRRILE